MESRNRQVAIVGRPNVGKSTLFNRLLGERRAIVGDEPGITRDRIYGEVEWAGKKFALIDTGGIGLVRREKAADVITKAAFDQVQIAIDSANVIILVVNVQEGVVPLDREVAARLRQSGKPVLVAVNKVDTYRGESGLVDFAALGFEKLLPVSAIHGEGIEPLMNEATKRLPPSFLTVRLSCPMSWPHRSTRIAVTGVLCLSSPAASTCATLVT